MAVAPPSGSEAPYTQATAADAPRGLLEKIEDFCSRPCFTESISDFASQHSSEFACEPNEGEHPVSLSRTPSHRTAPGQHTAATHCTRRRHTTHLLQKLNWDSPVPPTARLARRPLSGLTCGSFDGTSYTCSTRRS